MTANELFLRASFLALGFILREERTANAPKDVRVIHLAELSIDPAQLETYRAELKQEIESSIRIEPGVLTLYAVAIKGHPDKIRIIEIYRDQAAYQAHLATPHFKRYNSMTQGMSRA